MYERSGIPVRHTQQACAGLNEIPEWAKVRDRIRDDMGKGFLYILCGTRGPGKTQIAQQAISHSCIALREARYVRAMDIFLAVRATYKKSADDSEGEVVHRFRAPKLLVIDEVQERGETKWEDRVLTNLIDKRYGDANDTLLVANLSPATLKESLGPSVYDRLRETGGIIECSWSSFRSLPKGDPAPF